MSRGMTLTENITFVVEDCSCCHVQYALTTEMRDDMLAHPSQAARPKTWYCPNGHSQQYVGKSAAQKEREKREHAERVLANREDDLRVERMNHDTTRARLRATKAAHTKAKQRAIKGQCPEPSCRRPFANVARHVARCHPDIAPAQTRVLP